MWYRFAGEVISPSEPRPRARRSSLIVPPARTAPHKSRRLQPPGTRRRPSFAAGRICSACRPHAWSPGSGPWPASRTSCPTPSPSLRKSQSVSSSSWSTARTRKLDSPMGTSGDSCASPHPARTWTRKRSPRALCPCEPK